MEDIKKLIERYLEGTATDAEEDRLRRFFAQEGAPVPEEWRVYKALFAFEKQERATLAGSRNAAPHTTPAARRAKPWAWAATAAAAAAVIIAIAVKPAEGMPENYVIVNGKMVTTNRKSVSNEAEKAMRMVSAGSDDDFGALEMMRQ